MTESNVHSARFLFFGAVRDFLPAAWRSQAVDHRFLDRPSVKDRIETLGCPHTEVAHIRIGGEFTSLARRLCGGEQVEVYGDGASPPGAAPPALNARPLGEPRFVVDVNLGRLARLLRLLGFDTLYRNDYRDAEIASTAAAETRILLTRDRRLLMRRTVKHGYFVRADRPLVQIEEVLQRYSLAGLTHPFRRCTRCNGRVTAVTKAEILSRLEPRTRRYYDAFWQCSQCGQLYWEGSHMEGLGRLVTKLQNDVDS